MRAPPTIMVLAMAAAPLVSGADELSSLTCSMPLKTLTTGAECTQRCSTRSVACVALATSGSDAACASIAPLGSCLVPDYGCRTLCFAATRGDVTQFRFLVPFGTWQSDVEKQLRRNATEWWQTQVDALPRSTSSVPFLGNDYFDTVGPLPLSPTYRSINLAGGYTSDGGLKGKVAKVSLASDVFTNATNVTSVSFMNLHIDGPSDALASVLPTTLTQLRLVNCVLASVPSELARLTALESLNLSMNFLTTIPSTLALPALTSLDLTKNNLTYFEANHLQKLEILDLRDNFLDAIPDGVYALSRLKTLRVSRNPLRLAVATPEQYTFLSELQTLEMDGFRESVDCTSGEIKTLMNGAISLCVTAASEIRKLPVKPSEEDGGSNTGMIVGIVVGVFVALVVASIAGRKILWSSKKTTTSGVAGEFAKHESEGSDSAGGDFVGYGQNKQRTKSVVPNSAIDHSTTTSVTHSIGSSPMDRSTMSHHTNSSEAMLLSHHSTSSGGTNSNCSTRSVGRASPLTRTIVISRPLERSNLSGLSLWDDGELNAYLLKYEDIEDVRLIGSGGHGVVWLVNYRQSRLLASKRLVRDQVTRQKTFDFVAEIKLVAQLRHPSIVEFVGVAWTVETDLQALFEYMPNGDLRTYLEHTAPDGSEGRKKTIGAQDDSDSDEGSLAVLSWVHDKWQLALSVSEALVYVHSFMPPLVHRDLKSRNVLLSTDMKAKLSDFGVSRFESENGTMTANVGTGKWIAPEVIAGSKSYDASSDIYAFGVLLSELDTHRLPYDDVVGEHGGRLPEIALMQRIAANQLKPTFSSRCPRDILDLAMRCLSFDAKARPTAVNVAFDLRTYARKHGFFDVE